ncbi:MAG: abortive infection family protein [Candidatus Limiplasma sp.]|nr:abortive infection family protein [Candidatus Limiplasma sp.]
MDKISVITRRDIFDVLEHGVEEEMWGPSYSYHSMVGMEVEFLARLFDLESLPSTDSRFKNARDDIWQHTVNNYDWEGMWVKEDSRFLQSCSDETLLNFLAEIFHPIVRNDHLPWQKLLDTLNELLRADGFEIIEINKLSGRSVYGWRQIGDWHMVSQIQADALADVFSTDYIRKQIDIMMGQVEAAPHIAIGKAKELLETTCKQVLDERGIQYTKELDFNQLVKKAREAIGLTPKSVADDSPAKAIADKILGNLGQIAQGMSELRNLYGDGHGKSAGFVSLPPRYARLTVGTSTAVARFIWDTHIETLQK